MVSQKIDLKAGKAWYNNYGTSPKDEITGLEDELRSIEHVIGSGNRDYIIGNQSNNHLNGSGGNDTIEGHEGHDNLTGEDGNDELYGGAGNDIFYVDSGSDLVIEFNNEGIDTVHAFYAPSSSVPSSYTLGDNLENLKLRGNTKTGYGTSLNNFMTGTSVDNLLDGKIGNDTIYGYEGNDTIQGGADDDTLSGGIGSDIIDGGVGIDLVTEEGNVNFTLSVADNNTYKLTGLVTDTLKNIEQVELKGGGSNNILDARVATINVKLEGAGGDDTVKGGSGNDTVGGGTGNNSVWGGEGTNLLQLLETV